MILHTLLQEEGTAQIILLTLAAKRRRRGYSYLLQSFGDFCLSVRRNPRMQNGKGRLRESAHSRYTGHKGIVGM